jgi:hypothetical protein
MLCLGIGRAQVAAILVQAMPGTGGPKSWPMAMSQRQVGRLIRPGVVAMAARRIVATSKEGSHHCYQFHYLLWLQNSSSLTELFLKQCVFMLSFLEVVRPGSSLSLRI